MSNRTKNVPSPGVLQAHDRDEMPVSVRAYVHARQEKQVREVSEPAPPSEYILVFDTETTADAVHALRVGVYNWFKGDELLESGMFFAPDMPACDKIVLERGAAAHGCRLMPKAQFIDEIFYGLAYKLGATIVGLNLPFDISRLAISHDSARRSMRGGFTFKLSEDKRNPNVQVKHLSQRASIIRFAAPFRQRTPRGMRNRGLYVPIDRGSFVDVRTLAGALLTGSFSLARLSKLLKVPTQKLETHGHGKPLTDDYVRYAVQDVQATWECYLHLSGLFGNYDLSTHANQIYSEASLGKAYLKQMGVKPWRKLQPEFPPKLLGYIMSTYYGGRSEIHIRRVVKQVVYCDFVSMYPTVCTLMGLWRYVTAMGVEPLDATEAARVLLESVTLEDLQNPTFWPRLTTIVRLKPDSTLLPVRAAYGDDNTKTIGLNYLTSPVSLWYTLADLIASKLLTGNVPEIEEAIAFDAGTPQAGLKAILINGNPAFRVDPNTDDFYRSLIDLRREVKARMDNLPEKDPSRVDLDQEQNALKIAANATSYGIFVEVNVNEVEKLRTMLCEGPSGIPFEVKTRNIEEPGRYFHPVLATLITGAARLMLALVERLIADEGLEWVMCDTDSMSIGRPEGIPEKEFLRRAKGICSWFDGLNPYRTKGPILKIEDVNFEIGTKGKFQPVYCFAVSAKRYALFNIDPDGSPVLRKASAHGLGHLRAPYTDKNPSATMPEPRMEIHKIGVELWQHDLWHSIVSAALEGHPDQVDLRFHPALEHAAMSRYAATTPELLRWFDVFNRNLPYERQVRPFGFLVSLFAQSGARLPSQQHEPSEDRRKKVKPVQPVAPFTDDPAIAAKTAFDRNEREEVSGDMLKSYRQVLAQYHMHPEMKFLNGDYTDKGTLQRRHVRAATLHHIGKEANKWEQQFYVGSDEDAELNYGAAPEQAEKALDRLRRQVEQLGLRTVAKSAGLSERHLGGVLRGERRPSNQLFFKYMKSC